MRRAAAGLLLALLAVVSPTVAAKVLLTVQAALQEAFPGAIVERPTVYLTAEQKEKIEVLSGQEAASGIVRPARALRGGELAGTAYFDTHRVRTLAETLMVVVDNEGKVTSLEVLSFKEPLDYLPKEPWYRQFLGRSLDRELELSRGIHGVTGATLTARATTDAVRRVLATHQVLSERLPGAVTGG